MPIPPVNERLRLARLARGEDLSSIAQRIGVREPLLAAIENGQFGHLPAGLYGRAAIRSFAGALQLDPAEVLADCETLLPALGDPIDALARFHGVRASKRESSPEPAECARGAQPDAAALWKPLAAAAIDGGVIMGLLFTVVVATMIFCGASAARFGHSTAPAFGMVGVVLAWCYFACFGGIGGATLGECVIGLHGAIPAGAASDLHTVLARTAQCLTRDASCIRTLGDALGRAGAGWHTRMHSPTPSA